MRAGKLRHRITIEYVSESQNSYGEPIGTWATFDTVWASVEPLQGREFWTAKQLESEVTTRFRIRYRSGITTKHRIKYDSRYFDIKEIINPNELNKELHLMAVESV